MRLQLTCKEVARLLSDGQDAELPPTERARMRLHLVICENCRDISEQIDFLRRAVRRLGNDKPPAGD